jgi:uncharacterized protein YegL
MPSRALLLAFFLLPWTTLTLALFPEPVAGQTAGHVGQSFYNILKGEIVQSRAEQVVEQHKVLGYETGKDPNNGHVVVINVFRGSSAWYQGLRNGDQIVSERTTQRAANGLDATIAFRRDGSLYQVDLSATGDYRRLNNQGALGASVGKAAGETLQVVMSKQMPENVSPTKPSPTVPSQSLAPESPDSDNSLSDPNQAAGKHENFTLNAQQSIRERAKQALQGRDLVVLIDRSGSMSTTDCPQALSRWEWCQRQTMQLSRDVQEVFPRGFPLILFNNHTKSIENADLSTIADAFQTNQPDGGTDTGGAISTTLQNYWSQKNGNRDGTRPLVLLMITDGAANDPNRLRKTLIAAANESTRADEISVVFVQVGEDNQATADLEDLERNLNQEGAKFNIVHSVLFDKVLERGLFNALADALLARP